jgi:hypothetical protein
MTKNVKYRDICSTIIENTSKKKEKKGEGSLQ